jgi:enoyl-CoA hydratase/carnithine racemase
MTSMGGSKASHFLWRVDGAVAIIQLNRPERKNPLTFESYAELRDTFRKLAYADDIHAVVFLPNGGNFCSGGDVHDIIGHRHGIRSAAGDAAGASRIPVQSRRACRL